MSNSSAISSSSALAQNIQSINTQSKVDSDKDNSGALSISAANTAGAFMQSVMQSLQGLGLNVSGVSSTQTAAVTGSSSAVSSNTSKALQTFLHDLYNVLNQGNAGQQTSSDSDGDSDSSSGSTQAASLQSTYNNPSANLQNLISSLDNNSSSNTGSNTTLQTDFANLVQSLGGSTSSSTATNLQNFLKQLSANTGNGNALLGGLGSLFSAVA